MPKLSSGIHLQKAVGQKFTLYIPYRYTLGESVPLIMLLHWGGKKYRYQGRDMLEGLVLPALSTMEAIIVAPDRKRKHWATPKAIGDLEKLIHHMDQNYKLDSQNKVVVGYSEGGIGVWYLGAEYPELFSCGIALAAPIPEQIMKADWQFPVYSIHGRYDEMVPHDVNFKRAQSMKQNGAPLEFVTVENAMHTDVRLYIDPLSHSANWVRNVWGSPMA